MSFEMIRDILTTLFAQGDEVKVIYAWVTFVARQVKTEQGVVYVLWGSEDDPPFTALDSLAEWLWGSGKVYGIESSPRNQEEMRRGG